MASDPVGRHIQSAHTNVSTQQKSRDVFLELFLRLEDPRPITGEEFRRLLLKAQTYCLRELDSIAYKLSQR